jgi:regulatory protein
MPVITDIKTQIKNQDKVSVYIDDKYTFALTIAQLADIKEVRTGKDISSSQIEEYKKLSQLTNQYIRLISLIYARPRSEYELRTKLRLKKLDKEDIDELILKLQKEGYQDDLKFATWWVTSRKNSRPISSLKLRSELAGKGIKSSTAEQAISENFNQEDEHQALLKLIAKKKDHYETEEKLLSFLASRGYSYSSIKSALKELSDDNF